MKKLLLPLLLLTGMSLRAQTPIYVQQSGAVTPYFPHLAVKSLKIPVYIDSAHALAAAVIDSIGLIFKESLTSNIWIRDSNLVAGGHKWTLFASSGGGGGGSFDSATSQGGGFHTDNFNAGKYKKITDSGATSVSNYVTQGSRQKLLDSIHSLLLGTNNVTNSNLAQAPPNSMLVNNTGSTASLTYQTASQVLAFINGIANGGGAVSIKVGVFGGRPAASNSQSFFVATDSSKWYYDNGTWLTIGGGGSCGSCVINTGGANVLGAGLYSSKPPATSGTGLYYATDSSEFFYSNGSTWVNATPFFNIYFRGQGAPGDTSYVHGSGSNIYVAARRDSIDLHTLINPDSSRTSYVQAHDSTSANALQTKYRSDTARTNTWNAIIARVINAGNVSNLQKGTYASRPAASGNAGMCWFATDSAQIACSDGSTWTVVARANGGGGGSLTGTAGQSVFVPQNGSTTALPHTIHNYPLEQPWGTRDDRSYWMSPAYFSIRNGATGGLNDATVSVTSGVPTISSTSASWASVVNFIGDYPTILRESWDTIYCTMTQPVTANSTGGGPVVVSYNSRIANSYKFYVNTSTSSNGVITAANDIGTSYGTAAGTTIHQNDQLQMALTLVNDSTITFSYRNLTTASAWFSKSVSFSSTTSSTAFPPNTYNFGFLTFSQTPGATAFTIQRNKMGSSNIRYASNLIVGSSKSDPVGTPFFGEGYVAQLQASYPTTVNMADGGGTLQDILNRKLEVKAENPQVIIFDNPACNSLRYGVSIAQTEAQEAQILSWWRGSQTQIYIIDLPEDSVTAGAGSAPGLTAIKNFDSISCANGTYGPNVHYIDVWNRMTGFNGSNRALSSLINTDGIHPNATANAIIDSIIVAANVMVTADPYRLSPFRTYSPLITPLNDSLALAFNVELRKGYLLKVDDSMNVSASLAKDYDTYIGISANQTAAPAPNNTGTRFLVNGYLETAGNPSGEITSDQVNSTHYFYKAAANDIMSIGFNNGSGSSVPYYSFSKNGSLVIYTQSLPSTLVGVLQLANDVTYTGPIGKRGAIFNVDTATVNLQTGQTVSEAYGGSIRQITFNNDEIRNLSSFHFEMPKLGSGSVVYPTSSARFDSVVVIGNDTLHNVYASASTNGTLNFSYNSLTPHLQLDSTGNLFLPVTPATGTTSDNVVVWNSAAGQFKTVTQASIGGSSSVIFSQTATGSAIASGSAASIFNTSGATGSLTIPANSLSVGQTIEIHGYGVISSAGSTPGGFSMDPTIGGSGWSAVFTPASGLSNQGVEFRIRWKIITTGVSGTALGTMTFLVGGSTPYTFVNSGTTTINTTGTLALDSQLTWSSFVSGDSFNTSADVNIVKQ